IPRNTVGLQPPVSHWPAPWLWWEPRQKGGKRQLSLEIPSLGGREKMADEKCPWLGVCNSDCEAQTRRSMRSSSPFMGNHGCRICWLEFGNTFTRVPLARPQTALLVDGKC
ncbi:hypothetical protein BaRGS_00007923, partial [Batillaria attramentaria]